VDRSGWNALALVGKYSRWRWAGPGPRLPAAPEPRTGELKQRSRHVADADLQGDSGSEKQRVHAMSSAPGP